jgi:hypothetical protein
LSISVVVLVSIVVFRFRESIVFILITV